MIQIGYVNKVVGEKAQVIVRRISSCGENCASCKGSCNIPGMTVNIDNVLGAKEGDYIELRMKTNIILKSALIVYLIPLVLMIIGIAVGIELFKYIGMVNYESLGFLTGIVFLGISYFMLRKIDHRMREKEDFRFEMVRIINKIE